MPTPRVLILSGPSGVGKSSIIHRVLARRPEVQLSVSSTTRAPRPGERDGVDYHFIDAASFEQQIEQGGFLEWARSYDNYYGTGVREIERIMGVRRHPLLDVDTQGALQIQAAYRGAVYIFIKPPDLAILEHRLRSRGTESDDLVRKRLDRAEQEIAQSHKYDYIVVNNVLDDVVRDIIEIIDREKERPVQFAKLAGGSGGAPDAVTVAADKAARYAMEHIDREVLVQSLEAEMKTALRGELEGLIRERLERVLRDDLSTIVSEAYKQARKR